MRQAWLLVALGAVVGAAVTGLMQVVAGPGEAGSAADSVDARQLARLEEQVERLGEENVALLARLRDLELAALAGPGEPAEPMPLGAGPEVVLELQNQVDELAAAVERRGVETSDELVVEVAAALRAAEEREREVQRAERRAGRVERRLETLTTELSLDAYQQGRMRELLLTTSEQRDALEEMRRTVDRDERRAARDELLAKSQQQAASFLTSVQLEQLDEAGGLGVRGGDDRGRDRRRQGRDG